jgi:hypothetical protein
MKKVFFISVLALVCMVCTTSCSKDDDGGGATLTGISVAPQTITLPVGGEQKVTVTAEPKGATLGAYTITSENTSIATVTGDIVKIEGVGTTTLTVTCGSFTKTIAVTGTINGVAVTDSIGGAAGVYVYADTTITFTLTATITPASPDKTPAWSSSDETVATVTPAEDGLTAVIRIIKKGLVTITVTVDGETAEYTISTSSVLESAKGYWTFDDPDNLGKATIGDDLTVYEVNSVDGPSLDKKAIEAIPGDSALKWVHNFSADSHEYADGHRYASTFTLLFDVQSYAANKVRAPLYWNYNTATSCLSLRPRGSEGLALYANGNSWIYAPESEGGEWHRIVLTVYPVAEDEEGYEADVVKFHRVVYSNGKLIGDIIRGDNHSIIYIEENVPVWFLTMPEVDFNNPDGGSGDGSVPCSTIAVWNRVLSAAEVASLGGVSK